MPTNRGVYKALLLVQPAICKFLSAFLILGHPMIIPCVSRAYYVMSQFTLVKCLPFPQAYGLHCICEASSTLIRLYNEGLF